MDRRHRTLFQHTCECCGKRYVSENRKGKYCSEECLHHMQEVHMSGRQPEPGIMRRCRIVITGTMEDMYPHMRPAQGRVYDAERWEVQKNGRMGYIVIVGGHRIPVRSTECAEVAV